MAFFTPLLEVAFVAFLLPGMLGGIVGDVWYGNVTRRAGVAPRGAAWLLLVGGPAVIPLSVLLGHNPIGHALVFAAWMWLGVWAARGD